MRPTWAKQIVIPGMIVGLVLGVAAFWFTRDWRTPPTRPQPEGVQQVDGRPESPPSDAVKSEPEEIRSIESASSPPSQGLEQPKAVESTGEKQPSPQDTPASLKESKASELRETGTLSVNAQPWAEVWVDGKYQGETPLELELSAGRHRTVLVYESQKITKIITIKIGKVEHLTHVW